jgi:hypothetical protein
MMRERGRESEGRVEMRAEKWKGVERRHGLRLEGRGGEKDGCLVGLWPGK